MKKGFIGITDNDWANFIKDNNLNTVNFWCKKQIFKAIEKGDLFFFLKKNTKEEKKARLERKIVGYGVFERFEVLETNEAWSKYGIANGSEDIDIFNNKINSMFELNKDAKIGSIILEDIVMFDEPVYLSQAQIDFKSSIVSGKTITSKEVNSILELTDKEVEYVEENIDFDKIEIEEGQELKRMVNVKKRNNKARELKLKATLKKYGKVSCEVCGEDDIFVLDVHHDRVQVSNMKEGHKTRLSDLRVVCSNCHRKVHGHKLTVDELIDIKKK